MTVNIKFHLVREWEDLNIPSPFPASKAVPQWMKHLSPEAEKEDYDILFLCRHYPVYTVGSEEVKTDLNVIKSYRRKTNEKRASAISTAGL